MSLTRELVDWHQEQRCQKAVEALGQNGFTAAYCQTKEEAHDYIIRHSADADSVGFGGSRTVVDLGVQAVFEDQGKEIMNHLSLQLGLEHFEGNVDLLIVTERVIATVLRRQLFPVRRIAGHAFGKPRPRIAAVSLHRYVDLVVGGENSRELGSDPGARCIGSGGRS